MKSSLLFSFILLSFHVPSFAQAQVMHRSIPVAETHAEMKQMRGPHEVYWNKARTKRILLLSLGGTTSLPTDLKALDEVAAELGMDVITLDYDNSVISTTCKDSKDNACFDHFREEIATGKDVSSLVNVDVMNSLESRLLHTLKYLAQSDSARWSYYLQPSGVRWDRIVASGHSQGAGHAAYLSKIHALKGVFMLAGPQDRFEDGRVVPWIAGPPKTSVKNYYSLLHEKDFFGSGYQVDALKLLLAPEKIEYHMEMLTDQVQDPHMSVITKQFSPQWKKFLKKAAGF